ncbi:MAG: OsmC family protein [Desulfobacterales bacterium]|nr:OsmC family protein [Desulfobacterales bacterium]MCF8079464.1 OsmC family protein [Desulfobacterales bacterium]
MPIRKAEARWQGSLKSGKGEVKTESGALSAPYSFTSRFEEGTGTNPEELIAAAHAGCFSMALSLMLTEAGYEPDTIETTAKVSIEKQETGFRITRIDLETEVSAAGIDEKTFQEKAQAAKEGCPVSQALAGPRIELKARLRQ